MHAKIDDQPIIFRQNAPLNENVSNAEDGNNVDHGNDAISSKIEKLQRASLTPASIVPLAASNAMLFVGSHKTDCDCEFPLHLVLIVAGVLGLVLVTLQTLVK